MPVLKQIVEKIEALTEFLGWLGQWIVPITILVGFGNVILRYVGEFVGVKLTSNAIIELQWYLYTLIFFLGFAYITKHNINVRVDFWYANQSVRTKAMIDFIGHILALLPFCLLALYVTWNPVLTSWGLQPDGTWGTWEMSPDPSGLPRAPIKTMVIVAFGALLLQTIAELIKLIDVLYLGGQMFSIQESEAPLRIE
ncbi:MAG: TRAP transporter small permease subunit [Ardenticatenaceae bacterium]|nr:TRAP transporter small permease subunit [Ardenticatenaceae bacterium]